MERSELEHLLRAAGEIIDERQFIVIGSQSILGKYPNAPEELLRSREADFIAKNKPESTRMLEAIGEASRFYETYGYYADPVDSRTAVLPKDWKSRRRRRNRIKRAANIGPESTCGSFRPVSLAAIRDQLGVDLRRGVNRRSTGADLSGTTSAA